MKFLFKLFRFTGFTLSLFLLTSVVNPQKSLSSFLYKSPLPNASENADINLMLVGEIKGYSYIKMNLQSTDNAKRYKNVARPLKGSYYEAINSKTYRIIGSFNTQTLVWKLDCFENNRHTSVFVGKENRDGMLEGYWTSSKVIRRFYLKKTEK